MHVVNNPRDVARVCVVLVMIIHHPTSAVISNIFYLYDVMPTTITNQRAAHVYMHVVTGM